MWQDAYRNAFYRGLVLERLGQYPEAIRAYLEAATGNDPDPSAAIRLADLYESAEQWGDLVRMVRGLDRSVANHLPRLLELRELQRGGDLDPLVQVLLVRRRMLGMPFEIHVRRWEWEAAEAARLLAREPGRSVPLLQHALEIVGDHGFVHFALGLGATDEAIAILRSELQKSPEGGNGVMTLTYALKSAGRRGDAVLDELSALYPAVKTFRAYPYPAHWFLEAGIDFPPVPKSVVLPSSDPRSRAALERP